MPLATNNGLDDNSIQNAVQHDEDSDMETGSDDDWNSLFDEQGDALADLPARLVVPPIPGMFFEPSVLLPVDVADSILRECNARYFPENSTANQVMLFERVCSAIATSPEYGLPLFLKELLHAVDILLKPILPHATYAMLFPRPETCNQARQAILNLYQPGEGITPHVDLLRRYGDGIIGVSLQSGCTMRFEEVPTPQMDNITTSPPTIHDLYLPARSVIVLTNDARYQWSHGILSHKIDLVEGLDSTHPRYVARGTRLSVTFRWLLPGADVVGPDQPAPV